MCHHLILAFVTKSKLVLDTVEKKKNTLLPLEIRKNGFAALGGGEVTVAAFDTNRSSKLDHFLGWLDWEGASGVVILTDNSLEQDLNQSLGDQFIVYRFLPPTPQERSIHNKLTSIINKSLKVYKYLAKRFAEAKYQKILRLPLRNFKAPELAKIQNLCRNGTQQLGYTKEMDLLLSEMSKRQCPKKSSNYSKAYYIDDEDKHFELGHEHHALPDTAPPHTILCRIGNCFRFGQRFDGRTHYNVSKDNKKSMRGQYRNCHGENKTNPTDSHINMFSNDFF